MKRIVVTAALLASVCLFAQTGSLTAFDISYDGYTDGVFLEIDQSTGLVNGFLTGSIEGDILGVVAGVYNQGGSVVVSYPEGSFYEGLFTIIRDDGSWSHYFHDGNQVVEFNSGTWTRGIPSMHNGRNLTSSLDVVDDVNIATDVNKKDPPGVQVINKKPPAGVQVINKKPPGVK